MKGLKKFISMVLSVVMLLGLMPTHISYAATGNDIVAEARKWIGTPYGHSYGNGGYGSLIDCSGLTLQVFAKFGTTLPWFADSQRSFGTAVDYSAVKSNNNCSNLQVGDLIFFDYGSDGEADHVAIYSGAGNVIHAISRGVTETPLSWYWSSAARQTFYSRICDVKRIAATTSAPVAAHTHSWSQHYESPHPHNSYITCSCGETSYPGGRQNVASCQQCYPLGNAVLTRSFNKTGKTATFNRNNVSNANSYTLTLYRNGSVYGTYDMSATQKSLSGLQSGSYSARLTVKNTNTGQTKTAECLSFKIVDTYPVTYNANGGTNAPSAQTKIQDTKLTITSSVPTKTGYVFKGWAPNKTATKAVYQPGGSYTKNTKITLYAVWEPEIYTINFDVNGGKGEVDSAIITYGNSMKMPNSVLREGYYLKGWTQTKGATTPDYKLGLDYKLTSNAILYAVWGNSTWSGSVATGFAGGDGTKENPYQISNASELAYLADKVNQQSATPEYAYYILTDNINLGYEEWVPIGVYGNENQYFCGSFNGNGYTISDLSISDVNEGYIGLFGYTKDSEIKNLTVAGDIVGVDATTAVNIGAIVGYGEDADIHNCTVSYVNISDISNSSDSKSYIGCISGYISGSLYECAANDCYIGVKKGSYTSGICAGFIKGEIKNCAVESDDELFGTSAATTSVCAGGISGNVIGDVEQCTVNASFMSNTFRLSSGVSRIGGLIGYLNGKVNLCTVQFDGGLSKNIDNSSYNSSIFVEGEDGQYVGGIIGHMMSNASINNCKYDGESISNLSDSLVYSGGIVGVSDGETSLKRTIYGGEKLNYFDLPTKEGYIATWFTDSEFENEYDFSQPVSSNLTLYAKWEEGEMPIWDGTSSEPAYNSETKTYTITNGQELAWVSDVSNGVITSGTNFPESTQFEGYTIELANDIYLNDTSDWESYPNLTIQKTDWKTISSSNNFAGTIDGNNYCIDGIYNNPLLGDLDGKIQNINLANGYVKDCAYVKNNYGNIDNCNNLSSVYIKSGGGIVDNNNGNITNCYNEGKILNSGAGIADVNYSLIDKCTNAGEISGVFAGGICYNGQSGTIKNSNNYGKINVYSSGSNRANGAGIVCYLYGDSVLNCSNYGEITASYNTGGICGYVSGATIKYCYNLGTISGNGVGAGIAGKMFGTNVVSYCYNVGTIDSTYSGGILGDILDSTVSMSYCYSSKSPIIYDEDAANCTKTSVSYKSETAMKTLSNLTGFSTSVWGVDSSINSGYPYLLELEDTYVTDNSYTITFVEDVNKPKTIGKCFANIDGMIYSNSASSGAYAGGIIGYIPASGNSSNLIVIADRISAKTESGSSIARAGDIRAGATRSNFNNTFSYSSMELSAVHQADSSYAEMDAISSTRTMSQLKRASFLNTVFGPDTYQSVEYLKENPDTVWVIKDGELPELYYNVLNDISVSAVENGTIEIDKAQAVDGEIVTVTATPADGYVLNKIYVNGNEIAGNTFEVSGDSDVYATFAQNTPEYNIQVSATENASASLTNADAVETVSLMSADGSDTLSAKDGEEIVVSTEADEEYTVDAVYVNGEEMASDSFIVTDDSVVTMDVTSTSTDITATTYDATDIHLFSATVGGKIEGDDNKTSRYIRYWAVIAPDVIYTTEIEAGSGEYSVLLNDLDPETEYNFQMTENGDIKSFVTCEEETKDEEIIYPTVLPTNAPTPSPTSTPSPAPTLTPEPISTPTPAPTLTPEPTSTPTPTPTLTPEPISTPTPVPTDTPEPTSTPTPAPTLTPEPISTPTPVPTDTPEPTSVPTPETTGIPGDVEKPDFEYAYAYDINSIAVWEDCVEVNITNNYGNGGILVAAAYAEDGRLIGVNFTDISVVDESGNVQLKLNFDEAAYIAVFALDSITNMKPVSEKKCL